MIIIINPVYRQSKMSATLHSLLCTEAERADDSVRSRTRNTTTNARNIHWPTRRRCSYRSSENDPTKMPTKDWNFKWKIVETKEEKEKWVFPWKMKIIRCWRRLSISKNLFTIAWYSTPRTTLNIVMIYDHFGVLHMSIVECVCVRARYSNRPEIRIFTFSEIELDLFNWMVITNNGLGTG